MTHRHDVELIEVVFEAVALLIPGHRAFQGRHGVGGVRRIAGFHVDAQGHGAAAGGGEAVFHLLKLASHQGKQIGGFGERVVPNSEVALSPTLSPTLSSTLSSTAQIGGQRAAF